MADADLAAAGAVETATGVYRVGLALVALQIVIGAFSGGTCAAGGLATFAKIYTAISNSLPNGYFTSTHT